jgi:hypothetical protein
MKASIALPGRINAATPTSAPIPVVTPLVYEAMDDDSVVASRTTGALEPDAYSQEK